MKELTQHNAEKLEWISAPSLHSPIPDDQTIDKLHEVHGTAPNIRLHEERVAVSAVLFAQALSNVGIKVNIPLLRAAALTHDLRRADGGEVHAQTAATALREAGFHDVADLVVQHTELGATPCSEAQLLYLADKVSLKNKICTVDEREERMLLSYNDNSVRRRLNVAREIARRFEETTGQNIFKLLS